MSLDGRPVLTIDVGDGEQPITMTCKEGTTLGGAARRCRKLFEETDPDEAVWFVYEGVRLPDALQTSCVHPDAVIKLVFAGDTDMGPMSPDVLHGISPRLEYQEQQQRMVQPPPQLLPQSQQQRMVQPQPQPQQQALRDLSTNFPALSMKGGKVVLSDTKSKAQGAKQKGASSGGKPTPAAFDANEDGVVEKACALHRLESVPVAALQRFLLDRGVSAMGTKKALISRIEKLAPVTMAVKGFQELNTPAVL